MKTVARILRPDVDGEYAPVAEVVIDGDGVAWVKLARDAPIQSTDSIDFGFVKHGTAFRVEAVR